MKRTLLSLLLVMALLLGVLCLTAGAAELSEGEAFAYLENYADNVAQDAAFTSNVTDAIGVARESVGAYATIFSLLPPIIAIVLAFLTRKVYFSLVVGILCGALLHDWFNPFAAIMCIFETMNTILCDPWNMNILVFLVLLGMLVYLIGKSGGAAAYGRWAAKYIHTKTGALLSTSVLGMLIFIDDRFACMTLGPVARPVTDSHRISREKLAYIIDSTAAPVCVLVPISSWLAAVSGALPGGEGVSLFIRSIPYNLYAILTLVMLAAMAALNLDFGKMRRAEENAAMGFGYPVDEIVREEGNSAGTAWDLFVPIGALIACCFATMVYTGGFFDPSAPAYRDFVGALADSDTAMALVLGTVLALAVTLVLYIPRKVITFNQLSDSVQIGFQTMVEPILIQGFAWILGGVTENLGAGVFMAELLRGSVGSMDSFLPAVIFLVAVGLSFATGTSWGTFGVLLPIVCALLPTGELMAICLSACLAGAVCGDHCSPVSDTTIMSSASANCDHMNHVETQMPYSMLVAGVSLAGYLLAGFVRNAWIVLPVSAAVLLAILLVIRRRMNKET